MTMAISMAYIEINIFALVVLFLIFIRVEKYLFEQKLFISIIASNALLLILDSFMWLIDGKSGIFARYANIFISTLYLVSNPLPCLLWSLYANYLVYQDEKKIRKFFLPVITPTLMVFALVIISLFNGSVFYIDHYNYYHRGPLFLLMAFLCFIYLFYTLIFIIVKQNKIEKRHFIPILAFEIPPIVGGLLQSLFFGISLVWVSMTISVLIIFINIQTSQLYTDHLTGLYNRRQLDSYLKQKFKYNKSKKKLAGIMIDLNAFKEINDVWGHYTGDQALIDTAKILTTSFGKNDLIARYGGDEFIVILEVTDQSDLLKAVNRIKKNVKKFNTTTKTPYTISFSMGYEICDMQSNILNEKFIQHIDDLMYTDKKNR